MSWRRLLLALLLAAPIPLYARSDVTVRLNAPLTVPAGETLGTAVVLNDDAEIAGEVRNLIVVSGKATVTGSVGQSTAIVNGHLTLGPTARVGDVFLYHSTVDRDPAAVVRSLAERHPAFTFRQAAAWMIWLGGTLTLLAFSLLFAALAPRFARRAGDEIIERPGHALLAAAGVWLLLPPLALACLVTIVGIPLGLSILFVLLPALGFTGYLVTGYAVGHAILGREQKGHRPFGECALGVVVLQCLGIVPWLGGFVLFASAVLGGGAIAWAAFAPRHHVSTAPLAVRHA